MTWGSGGEVGTVRAASAPFHGHTSNVPRSPIVHQWWADVFAMSVATSVSPRTELTLPRAVANCPKRNDANGPTFTRGETTKSAPS